ncbi:MAG: glycosyltransferase family 4 protein [Dehalococcoidia bacterium]
MHIIQVRQKFPIDGGVEYHIHCLSRRLIEQGHRVSVFTSDRDLDWKASYGRGPQTLDGIEVRRFAAPVKVFRTLLIPSLLPSLLRDTQGQVIHAHGFFYPSTDMAALASLLGKRPLVYTPHLQPYSVYTEKGERWARAVYESTVGRFAFKVAKRVIAVSEFTKNYMVNQLGVDEGKITVIPPSGVEQNGLGPPPTGSFRDTLGLNDHRVALFVGHISPRKGLKHLVRAMPAVLQAIGKVKFVVIGPDRGEKAALVELAARLGTSESLIFTGHLNHGTVMDAYPTADVFVLPSEYEAFGIVLLEAMAAGRPVIASRVGGTTDIVQDGQTGLLVDGKDPGQLAQAIIRLLRDREEAAKLGERAREYVIGKYSWDSLVERTLQVYREALNGL